MKVYQSKKKKLEHARSADKTSAIARRTQRRGVFLTAAFIAVTAIALFACWKYWRSLNVLTIDEPVEVYVNSVTYSFDAPLKIVLSEDGALLKKDDAQITLSSRPVYTKSGRIYLSANFLYMDYDLHQCYRVPQLTCLKGNAGGSAIIGDTRTFDTGFLFDGADTYIFLSRTMLRAGDRTVVVPPLSYAIVTLDRSAEIVSADTGNTVVLQLDAEGIIAQQGECSVDLNLDIVQFADESRQLLPSDFSQFPEIL